MTNVLISEALPQLQALTKAYFEANQGFTLPQAIGVACRHIGLTELDEQTFIMLAMPILTAHMNRNYVEKHMSLDAAIDEASRQTGYRIAPAQRLAILKSAEGTVSGKVKPSADIQVQEVSDREFAETVEHNEEVEAVVTRKEVVRH
jgi:hypothetical protein